jgi:hypothetical protein
MVHINRVIPSLDYYFFSFNIDETTHLWTIGDFLSIRRFHQFLLLFLKEFLLPCISFFLTKECSPHFHVLFTRKYLRTPGIEPGLAEPSLKASNQQSRCFGSLLPQINFVRREEAKGEINVYIIKLDRRWVWHSKTQQNHAALVWLRNFFVQFFGSY